MNRNRVLMGVSLMVGLGADHFGFHHLAALFGYGMAVLFGLRDVVHFAVLAALHTEKDRRKMKKRRKKMTIPIPNNRTLICVLMVGLWLYAAFVMGEAVAKSEIQQGLTYVTTPSRR